MQTEIRQVRISVWVFWCRWGSAEVIGVVATECTFHLIVICRGGWEDAGFHARVDGGLVDAAELVICCDALGDVEGVEGDVAGVVVGEEARVNDALGI